MGAPSSNALWNGFSKISGCLLCCRGTSSTLFMFSPKAHLPVYWKSGMLAEEVSQAVLLAPGNTPGKLSRLWKKIQLLFSATEKIELSWEAKHLNETSGMQTKICFRNILRCEGKYLSLKAGVLKAEVYLTKHFFLKKKIELKVILPPKECRFKLPSQTFVLLCGCWQSWKDKFKAKNIHLLYLYNFIFPPKLRYQLNHVYFLYFLGWVMSSGITWSSPESWCSFLIAPPGSLWHLLGGESLQNLGRWVGISAEVGSKIPAPGDRHQRHRVSKLRKLWWDCWDVQPGAGLWWSLYGSFVTQDVPWFNKMEFTAALRGSFLIIRSKTLK